MVSELLKAVTIAAGDGVGRLGEQSGDFLEGVSMPDFEDDDFALSRRQRGQGGHHGSLAGCFLGGSLKPAVRFELAKEAPPKPAPVVDGPVAVGANAVVIGLRGSNRHPQKTKEEFLEDVLSFAVAQAERAAIKKQFPGLEAVEGFAPIGSGLVHSSPNRQASERICIRICRGERKR